MNYQNLMSVLSDNTDLGFDNSWYHAQPHPIIVYTKSSELSNVISIDSNLVSRVSSNKCLGVLLDEKLTFETHIDCICKKACAGIGALRTELSLLFSSAPS